jgi:segregation and condensation protein A
MSPHGIMFSMDYHVKTQHFEGPLDLLLVLIEDRKLDITQVSLAHVTDAYLEYIREQDTITLSSMTDFLSVAAKLVLIKSRALLPLLQFDEEEEQDIAELERQLAALAALKDSIADFATALELRQSLYARKSMWGTQAQFIPAPNMTLQDLENAFKKSLYSIPQLDAIEEKIIADVMSLEQKISHIQSVVMQRAETVFSDIGNGDRRDVVVSFLALLELVKQKIIVAKQGAAFNDIILKSEVKS